MNVFQFYSEIYLSLATEVIFLSIFNYIYIFKISVYSLDSNGTQESIFSLRQVAGEEVEMTQKSHTLVVFNAILLSLGQICHKVIFVCCFCGTGSLHFPHKFCFALPFLADFSELFVL